MEVPHESPPQQPEQSPHAEQPTPYGLQPPIPDHGGHRLPEVIRPDFAAQRPERPQAAPTPQAGQVREFRAQRPVSAERPQASAGAGATADSGFDLRLRGSLQGAVGNPERLAADIQDAATVLARRLGAVSGHEVTLETDIAIDNVHGTVETRGRLVAEAPSFKGKAVTVEESGQHNQSESSELPVWELRRAANIKQAELADHLGLSPAAISNIETESRRGMPVSERRLRVYLDGIAHLSEQKRAETEASAMEAHPAGSGRADESAGLDRGTKKAIGRAIR